MVIHRVIPNASFGNTQRRFEFPGDFQPLGLKIRLSKAQRGEKPPLFGEGGWKRGNGYSMVTKFCGFHKGGADMIREAVIALSRKRKLSGKKEKTKGFRQKLTG
jgi:hypothetical protein